MKVPVPWLSVADMVYCQHETCVLMPWLCPALHFGCVMPFSSSAWPSAQTNALIACPPPRRRTAARHTIQPACGPRGCPARAGSRSSCSLRTRLSTRLCGQRLSLCPGLLRSQ